MENQYPLFEQNRILKKEYLWALRDYSFGHIQLEYQEYADGIIRGCQVEVREKNLVVKPGMLKYQGFLCLLTKEQVIPYKAAERLEVLKIQIIKDTRSKDQITYQMCVYLDSDPERKENEFELCRFELRQGAELRTNYTDLSDMGTAYDTVNPIYATWSGIGKESLSPVVTRYYAEQILKCEGSDAVDLAFAWMCLNTTGAISCETLISYINRKQDGHGAEVLRHELYISLVKILKKIQSVNKRKEIYSNSKHKILVD